ncbi:transposase family protein [Streptomyces sp. NPDC057555]|uniref:transposase family protein n=1 Tax=Streptomyces sp. NPDC057555 TaxID=3346166 RepID=UPI0036C91850
MGAGAKHQRVFVGQPLATLVHLRHNTTHNVLACRFSVDHSETERGSIIREAVRAHASAPLRPPLTPAVSAWPSRSPCPAGIGGRCTPALSTQRSDAAQFRLRGSENTG